MTRKKPALELPMSLTPVGPVIAIDAEWAPDKALLTLALADTKRAQAVDRELMDPLDPSVLHEAEYIAGHNVPGDLDYLVALGECRPEWADGTKVLDSYILARLVNENLGSKKVDGKGPYNLERLLRRVYEVPPWKMPSEQFNPKDATTWPPDVRVARCATDAWASAVLVERLASRVPVPVRTFAHRLTVLLHRVYLTGVAVDRARISELGDEWKRDSAMHRELLTRAAQAHGMTEFSPTKDADLRVLLYRKLKLPVTRRTPKGRLPAVDQVTLGQFKDNTVVQHLLAFNRADKMIGSWFGTGKPGSKAVPLVGLIEPGPDDRGWLRAVLNASGTRTGRRSSGGENDRGETAGKNMQNWPPQARSVVVSRYPGGQILGVDYSRLEVVLFAWRAQDERLFEYFYRGEGYVGIARDLFGKPVEKDTPEYVMAKSTVLAVQYGARAWKMAEQFWFRLGIRLAKRFHAHVDKVDEIRSRYLRLFPGIRPYMQARKREVIETGRVEIVPGHYRHLPGYANLPEKWQRKHLVNEAINAPVQGLAAYVTGSALLDVEGALLAEQGLTVLQHYENLLRGAIDYSVLINEVHDEVVVDLHPENAERDQELVIETMRAVPTFRALMPGLKFPFKVEAKVGPRWRK